MNEIKTWAQGKFIDMPQYDGLTREWKQEQQDREKYLVRAGPTSNAICKAFEPLHAEWIASRLNLASTLEQMTYDYATGKTDGHEIVDLVMANAEG